MPPLFSCRGCGLSIERSMATYRRLRGQVLCSTCQDKQNSRQGETGVHVLNIDHHPPQPEKQGQ